MFTGKKITNNSAKQIVQAKPGKVINTKVTDQIIIKSNRITPNQNSQIINQLNGSSQNVHVETKRIQNKIKKSREKKKSKSRPKQKQNKNRNSENRQQVKNNEYFRNGRQDQNKKQNNKEDKHLQRVQKIEQNKIKQTAVYDLKQEQQIQDKGQEQSQLSGENQFIEHAQEYDEQQQQQIFTPPSPYQSGKQAIKSHKAETNQMGLNMEVFELEVDQIMSKDYFVI